MAESSQDGDVVVISSEKGSKEQTVLLDVQSAKTSESMALEMLYMAVKDKNSVVVETLLKEKEIDINHVYTEDFIQPWHRGYGVLHISIDRLKANIDLVKVLIDFGADPSLKNKNGDTALHIACKHGRAEIVKLILENSSFLKDMMNNQGSTPLIKTVFHYKHAFKNSYLKSVKYLFESGCDANICALTGLTALHLAIKHSCSDLVKFLIENGADVNCSSINIMNPLLTAICATKLNTSIIQYLLDAGADVNVSINNETRRSPLHLAILKSDDYCANFLLKAGADPNALDNYGKSPLWIAVEENNLTIIPLLVNNGADVNFHLAPQHLSLLSLAVGLNSVQMVVCLLQHGVSVYTETRLGLSPLHLAVKSMNIEMIHILLNENCDMDVISNSDCTLLVETPFQYALKTLNFDVIMLLLVFGCHVEKNWIDQWRRKCFELGDEQQELFMKVQQYIFRPKPLLHMCRITLRKCLQYNFHEKVQSLRDLRHIPEQMRNYLKFNDILQNL